MGKPGPSALRGRPDSRQRRAIVQRRQLADVLQGLNDLLAEHGRVDQSVPAMHYPVADSLHPILAQVPQGVQPLDDPVGGLAVVGDAGCLLDGAAVFLTKPDAAWPTTYPLYVPFRKSLLLAGLCGLSRGLDQPELQGRAAAVDGNDLHVSRPRGTESTTTYILIIPLSEVEA